MRVYVDSSALLKRVFAEPDSPAAVSMLRERFDAGATLAASSLAWVEVSRVVLSQILGASVSTGERRSVDDETALASRAEALIEIALSGLVEKPISSEVIALARRLRPPVLRSLDAIHLASALLLDVDRIMTYDQRLAVVAGYHGIQVETPRRVCGVAAVQGNPRPAHHLGDDI